MMSRVGLLAVVDGDRHRRLERDASARAAPGEDAEEPGARSDTEAPAPRLAAPAVSASAADGAAEGAARHRAICRGVGLRARYVSVPGWLLGFLHQAQHAARHLRTLRHRGISPAAATSR